MQDEPPRAVVGLDFRSFYLAEFGALVALTASVSGDPGEAEDLAQEALGRAHQRWSTIEHYDNPGTWVRRFVINLALNRRRSLARRTTALFRLASRRDIILPDESDETLWRAVGELPAKQRAAVALHYLEDRPVDEIAEVLGCSESTAKVHLHKARRRLYERLCTEGSRQ